MLASSFLMSGSQNSLISEFWDFFFVERRGTVNFFRKGKNHFFQQEKRRQL